MSDKEESGEVIQGFDDLGDGGRRPEAWTPVSDRKIRVGIAGYGLCKFGAAFGFQDHPNVEVVAVTDLIPSRCAGLAKACRCEKTYPSCEEMIKDDKIEAVFIATDAPSHARLAVAALQRGKHVASAVPRGLRFDRGRRPAVRGRKEEWFEVHDVRDFLLPLGSLRMAPAVPSGNAGPDHLLRG